MIEVLVRLGGEEPQREMVVRARNIIDALCVAEEHSLDGKVSVVFPIDAPTGSLSKRRRRSSNSRVESRSRRKPGRLAGDARRAHGN